MPSGKQKKSKGKGAGKAPAQPRKAPAKAGAPIVQTRVTVVKDPVVRANGRGVTVRHREYVADVTIPSGAPAFTSASFPINPGMSSLFPWLSTMANSYELYVFHRLKFEYVTRSPATTGGSVYLAIDWDACDVTPADKQTMLGYSGAVSDAAWQGMVMDCATRNLTLGMKERYTRAGEYTDIDQKTYDVGVLILATESITTLSEHVHVGEIWVDYEVELLVPQIRQSNRAASIAVAYPAADPYDVEADDPVFAADHADSQGIRTEGAPPGHLSADGKTFVFSRPWSGIVRSTISKTTSSIRALTSTLDQVEGILDLGNKIATSILYSPPTGVGLTTDVVETFLKVGLGDRLNLFSLGTNILLAAAVTFMTGPYSSTGVFPGAFPFGLVEGGVLSLEAGVASVEVEAQKLQPLTYAERCGSRPSAGGSARKLL